MSGEQAGGLRVWDVIDAGAPVLHALATGSGYPARSGTRPTAPRWSSSPERAPWSVIATPTGEVLGRLTDQKVGLPSYFPEPSRDWSPLATVSAATAAPSFGTCARWRPWRSSRRVPARLG